MELNFESFRKHFDAIAAELNLTWEAVGFLTKDDKVYPFGTDSKVLSTIFESLSAPLVQQIAENFDYVMESAPQTIYPDLTLTPKGGKPPRIAIDIKTTYRNFNTAGKLQPFRYTLGSYTSFLRSPKATKNIKYPYGEYGEHWIIGFLYTRVDGVAAKVYARQKVGEMLCPYCDVEYFIQKKYKIIGLAPGSGNTANIGSFPTSDIQALRDGLGPFSEYGKELCDNYWSNYGRTAANREYTNIKEFLRWQKHKA